MGTGGSGTFEPGYFYEAVYAQAGRDVVGATLHTAKGDVEASLAGGFLAAWWPSEQPSGNDPLPPVSATLRLRDGRTVEVTDLDKVSEAAAKAAGITE